MGYSREFNNSAEAGNFSLPSSVRYFSVTRLVLLDFFSLQIFCSYDERNDASNSMRLHIFCEENCV